MPLFAHVRKQQSSKAPRRKLDLLFIQDTTASQEPYIKASIERCKEVVTALQGSGSLEHKGLRLGLLAFRDHNDEYVVKDFGGFTESVDVLVSNLTDLKAEGGEDYPEAVTAALDRALNLVWRQDAAKIAILITDAAPHGIGEAGDAKPKGDPDGKDPLVIAKRMAKRGIHLLVIACEPELSNSYRFAHDFYTALAKITFGIMLPLTRMELLAPLIIGFALENLTIDSLVLRFRPMVISLHREGKSEADIVALLSNLLQSLNTNVVTLESSPVYLEPRESSEAVSIWMAAKDTPAATNLLLKGGLAPEVPRVPENFFTSSTPMPKHRIPITLKNMRDFYIQYRYMDDGEAKMGTLDPYQIEQPTALLLSTPYHFTLQVGTNLKNIGRTFIKDEDIDLSQYFEGFA